jgi:SAM-dependent methyltransferase
MDELNDKPEVYFSEAYQHVMYTGAVGVYSKFVHYVMERQYANKTFPNVLEVGAGHGQHQPFVRHTYSRYVQSDIDIRLSANTQLPANVVNQQLDAQDLTEIPSASVDRLIATCLLAHLDQPEAALREWDRVVKPGGAITIYVPCEPGMLLRLSRWLFVAPKSRRVGQDHYAVIYSDHRNHFPGMRALLKKSFRHANIRRSRFPFAFFPWNFNLFEVWHITKGI